MLRRTPLPPRRLKPRRKGKPAPRIKPRREEDPEHLDRVRALGCCICGTRPAEAHHIRDHNGTGAKAGDHEAIPLCDFHHRTGGMGVAFHAGPRTWERIHGPQRGYLALVLVALEVPDNPADLNHENETGC